MHLRNFIWSWLICMGVNKVNWSIWNGQLGWQGWPVNSEWLTRLTRSTGRHIPIALFSNGWPQGKIFHPLWVVVWQIFSNKHIYILSIDATGGFITISQHSNNTCVQQLYIPYWFWVSPKVCIYTHISFYYKWWLSIL